MVEISVFHEFAIYFACGYRSGKLECTGGGRTKYKSKSLIGVVKNMAYQMMEGNRKGSFLYCHNGYTKFREYNCHIHLICSKWRSDNCDGVAKLIKVSDTITVITKLKLSNAIKREATASTTNLRAIFDTKCGDVDNETAAMIEFPKLQSTMYKLRRTSQPPTPTRADKCIALPQEPMNAPQHCWKIMSFTIVLKGK